MTIGSPAYNPPQADHIQVDASDTDPDSKRYGDLVISSFRLTRIPSGCMQQTDLRNRYKIGVPPLAGQTTQFTFYPTLLGPVVRRFLDSTLLEANSEYTSDDIYLYWSPFLQHALKSSSGGSH
jgi:hypothetical protein